MSFRPIFEAQAWDDVKASIYAKTAADVERALAAPRRTLDDFKALISPAAAEKLLKGRELSKRFSNALSSLIVKPPGKPSLVPITDKRTALSFDPSAGLSDMPDCV